MLHSQEHADNSIKREHKAITPLSSSQFRESGQSGGLGTGYSSRSVGRHTLLLASPQSKSANGPIAKLDSFRFLPLLRHLPTHLKRDTLRLHQPGPTCRRLGPRHPPSLTCEVRLAQQPRPIHLLVRSPNQVVGAPGSRRRGDGGDGDARQAAPLQSNATGVVSQRVVRHAGDDATPIRAAMAARILEAGQEMSAEEQHDGARPARDAAESATWQSPADQVPEQWDRENRPPTAHEVQPTPLITTGSARRRRAGEGTGTSTGAAAAVVAQEWGDGSRCPFREVVFN